MNHCGTGTIEIVGIDEESVIVMVVPTGAGMDNVVICAAKTIVTPLTTTVVEFPPPFK
jgi:hypothetical protein